MSYSYRMFFFTPTHTSQNMVTISKIPNVLLFTFSFFKKYLFLTKCNNMLYLSSEVQTYFCRYDTGKTATHNLVRFQFHGLCIDQIKPFVFWQNNEEKKPLHFENIATIQRKNVSLQLF